jgi:excisionase family DNA binding protein
LSDVIRKARRVSVIVAAMGCDKTTIIRMLEDGRLDGYRIGHLCYVYLDSVEKYRRKHSFVAHGDDG